MMCKKKGLKREENGEVSVVKADGDNGTEENGQYFSPILNRWHWRTALEIGIIFYIEKLRNFEPRMNTDRHRSMD